MSLIVCQAITDRPDQLSLTWSNGINSFEPYTLGGLSLMAFRNAAQAARDRLADLVHLHLGDTAPDQESLRLAGHALATAGHDLYTAIFAPAQDQQVLALDVLRWLAELQSEGTEADTLQFVNETDIFVPWNVVYDQKPAPRESFPLFDHDPTAWRPFWGVRYILACGRRVNPLRSMPRWEQPDVILVIDPAVRAKLDTQSRERLDRFITEHKAAALRDQRTFIEVDSRENFAAALQRSRDYLVYWLSHATPNELVLNNTPIRPLELMTLLRGDPLASNPVRRGLLFLNACRTAQGGRAGSFLDAVYSAGLSGLIATEEYTINTFAHPFGLDFLKKFLDDGTPLGESLHRLRSDGLPLGLLYTAYCPPDIHLRTANTPSPNPDGTAPAEGIDTEETSSTIRSRRERPPALPEWPYRGLSPYRSEHRALFAGRDNDIVCFAELLNEPEARLLLLHGELGVGKSSFLEAGILPYLELECVGYRALCNRRSGPNSKDGTALFIRAGRDLVGQIARALCDFASKSYLYTTPSKSGSSGGRKIEVPLGQILADLIPHTASDALSTTRVRDAILADPSLPARFLAEASSRLPFGLVMVVDQAEEIFTLSGTDLTNRQHAIAMLCRTAETAGDFKLILAIRTEYYGRLTDALREGINSLRGVRNYCLTVLDHKRLEEAITRPTETKPLNRHAEAPHHRYQFEYAPGMAEDLALQIQEESRTSFDCPLLLMQVICARLYLMVKGRPNKTITPADLTAVGGVKGATRLHAEAMLDRLLERTQPDTDLPGEKHLGGKIREGLFFLLAPQTAEKTNLKRMFGNLQATQPDGRATPVTLPEDDLQRHWHGRRPFREVVTAAADESIRLLRETVQMVGGEERKHFSLGHDALAPVAAAWGEGARTRRAVLDGLIRTLLAMLIIGGGAAYLLWRVDSVAREELIGHSKIASALTAESAASKLPWKVRRYWTLLQDIACDSKLIELLGRNESPGFHTELQLRLEQRATAAGKERDQKWAKNAKAWVVLDAQGTHLANTNPEAWDLFGDNSSFRDYFHGQGIDVEEACGLYGPVDHPHLSMPFAARVPEDPPRVACSVPIRSKDGTQIIGVLVLTVDPKDFVELPTKFDPTGSLVLFHRKGDPIACVGPTAPPKLIRTQVLTALERGDRLVTGLAGGTDSWICAQSKIDFDSSSEHNPCWSVIVARRQADVVAPLNQLWWWALGIGIAALLVVFLIQAIVIPMTAYQIELNGLIAILSKVLRKP